MQNLDSDTKLNTKKIVFSIMFCVTDFDESIVKKNETLVIFLDKKLC